MFYNNSIVKDAGGKVVEEIEPIDVDYNDYFNFLVVLTKYLLNIITFLILFFFLGLTSGYTMV